MYKPEETMGILKTLNLAVRFLLELCMLVAVGYWGFETRSGAMRIVLGIGLPVLLIVTWSLFVAPKAVYPLRGIPHIVVSLILLSLGALALFASGRASLGWAYVVILVVNQILLIVWKQ
jgi:hypothetical protein